MLTRRHGIASIDPVRRQLVPDQLTHGQHAQYPDLAAELLEVYGSGHGRTRQELHEAVGRILSRDAACPPRRVEAFCKLLDDAATFRRVATRDAAELRRTVFNLAAAQHPLVSQADLLFGHAEHEVKQRIAAQLDRAWEELDRELYADYPDAHYLSEFNGPPSAKSLLSRYNVGQYQVALLDAVHMTIWARRDYKQIVQHAKLAQLMHAIVPLPGGGYRIRLDGPATLLRRTARYGTALARFLPALIACRDWTMHAVLRQRCFHGDLGLDLSATGGLHSHLPAPREFDSGVEQRFAADWGEERDGWRLSRETDILCRGQKAFLPDFTLQHHDGRRVLLEIVGYWTASYLEAKVRTLQCFAEERILLAVARSSASKLPQLATGAILFRRNLPVEDVLNRLRQL